MCDFIKNVQTIKKRRINAMKKPKYFIKKRTIFLGIDGTTLKLRVEANPEEYYILMEGVSTDTSKYDGHAYYCEIDMSKNINLDDFFIELIPFKQ